MCIAIVSLYSDRCKTGQVWTDQSVLDQMFMSGDVIIVTDWYGVLQVEVRRHEVFINYQQYLHEILTKKQTERSQYK